MIRSIHDGWLPRDSVKAVSYTWPQAVTDLALAMRMIHAAGYSGEQAREIVIEAQKLAASDTILD